MNPTREQLVEMAIDFIQDHFGTEAENMADFALKAIAEYEERQLQMAKDVLKGTVSAEQVNTTLDEIIKEAIAEHERKAWYKYPNWCPSSGKSLCQLRDGTMRIKTFYSSTRWDDVIAFRELPAQYQEGGEG